MIVRIASVILPVLAVIGCGRSDLAPVRGQVVCNGKAVVDGTVIFSPISDSSRPGKGATGQLDAEGKFVLSTDVQGDGALIGKHRVAISLNDPKARPTWDINAKRSLEVKPGSNDFTIDLCKP
ncbi:MAG: hypothetical protein U0744_13000 [Gemmataceae bacterium]